MGCAAFELWFQPCESQVELGKPRHMFSEQVCFTLIAHCLSLITDNQIHFLLLQPGPNPPMPPQPALAIRRPLPTHHDPSSPPPLITAFLQTRSICTRTETLRQARQPRYNRPLLLQRPHLLYRWERCLPRSLGLPKSPFQLDTYLPRRTDTSASSQNITVLQMGRLAADSRK